MPKAKSKLAKFVGENADSTFYCGKCGRSGFQSVQSVRGHLGHCKGYAKVIQEAKQDGKTLIELATELDLKYRVPPISPTFGGPRVLGTPTTLPTTLGTTSGATSMSRERPRNLEAEKLRIELLAVKQHNQSLEKIAFNHNEHANMAIQNRTFSGPQDMVNASLGDLFKYPIVRVLAGLVGIGMLIALLDKYFGPYFRSEKTRTLRGRK